MGMAGLTDRDVRPTGAYAICTRRSRSWRRSMRDSAARSAVPRRNERLTLLRRDNRHLWWGHNRGSSESDRVVPRPGSLSHTDLESLKPACLPNHDGRGRRPMEMPSIYRGGRFIAGEGKHRRPAGALVQAPWAEQKRRAPIVHGDFFNEPVADDSCMRCGRGVPLVVLLCNALRSRVHDGH
jgi:hypothetical protein